MWIIMGYDLLFSPQSDGCHIFSVTLVHCCWLYLYLLIYLVGKIVWISWSLWLGLAFSFAEKEKLLIKTVCLGSGQLMCPRVILYQSAHDDSSLFLVISIKLVALWRGSFLNIEQKSQQINSCCEWSRHFSVSLITASSLLSVIV